MAFRVSPGGNSGVGIRAGVPYITLDPNTLPSNVGLELQIKDDVGDAPTNQSSGSFYAVHAPRVVAVKPAGDWNTLEIICQGAQIRVTLNDQLVQEVNQTQVDAPRGRLRCGYLSLQNHGHDIDFRKVKLREIDFSP